MQSLNFLKSSVTSVVLILFSMCCKKLFFNVSKLSVFLKLCKNMRNIFFFGLFGGADECWRIFAKQFNFKNGFFSFFMICSNFSFLSSVSKCNTERRISFGLFSACHRCFAARVRIVPTKEYILLVIEGIAPAIVLKRCDSPNLSPRLPCQTVR